MGKIVVFRKGEIICRQGDPSLHMYDICVGSVGVYTDYETDRQKQLTILKKGEFFGEMGMIESHLRSATVVALEEDTLVRVITPGDFNEFFQEDPEKLLTVLRNMSRRIHDLTQDYLDVCRAASEMIESGETDEEAGKEKSSWLKQNIRRIFMNYDHLSRQKSGGSDGAR